MSLTPTEPGASGAPAPAPQPAAGTVDLGFNVVLVRTQWREVLRRFRRHKLAMGGAIFLVLMFLACFIGAMFAQDPYKQDLLTPISGPGRDHWFGTDRLSRDQLARVLYGGRISLLIGLGVAVGSSLLGTTVGAIAGYYGGRLDNWLMRFVDLVLTLPALPLLLVAQSIGKVGPLKLGSPLGITLILISLFWTQIARVIRGVFLSLREKEFVEAARASGASNTRIMVRHILPNAMGPVIVNTTLVVAFAILTESVLSFLGFGVVLPTPTWGNLLDLPVTEFQIHPWQLYFPGLAIFLTVLSVAFVGDGLRDAFDPSQKRVRT